MKPNTQVVIVRFAVICELFQGNGIRSVASIHNRKPANRLYKSIAGLVMQLLAFLERSATALVSKLMPPLRKVNALSFICMMISGWGVLFGATVALRFHVMLFAIVNLLFVY